MAEAVRLARRDRPVFGQTEDDRPTHGGAPEPGRDAGIGGARGDARQPPGVGPAGGVQPPHGRDVPGAGGKAGVAG